jgi:alkanesulfonate monooxygenase SsuD/methylene tetrahydromethanopterin reductase-like flavin-dependent oxidoreductase (luciferase family)
LLAAHLGQHVKCRIGTAVGVLPYRHPLEWAGDAAATDRLIDGRLEFGVARGAYQYEFDRFGIDMAESKDRFEETLRTIVKLWTAEEAVPIEDKYFSMPPTTIWPRPLQRPHPPIWVGAQSEPTTRWAVREGYHVFNAPFFKPLSHTQQLVDVFREECDETGVAPGALRFGSLRWAFVSHDEKEIARALQVVRTRQRIVSHLHSYDQSVDARGFISSEPIPGEPSLEEARANQMFGTPEEVLEKLLAYDATGTDHLMLGFQFGLGNEEIHDSMRLFAEEVMAPYFRHVRERGAERSALAAPAADSWTGGDRPAGY